nr:zinc finger, CCHC-type [Tanacetum cinerariifolium]
MDLQKKLKVDETIEKFKARLVIRSFKRKPGIDYFDTYAPVARISTIRLLIAMTTIYNLIIHQMDVKTTFLNGELDEEVDLTREFLSSRFSMKDMGEADVILVSTPMNTSEKLMPNNGQAASQLKYTSNRGTQHWTPNSLLRKLGSRVQCGKLNVKSTEAHVFTYHLKDMLGTC